MDRETAALTKRFSERVRKKYQIEKILLFGSRARGDHLKTSDFDILVISKDFQGIPFAERMSRMYDFWEAPLDLEAIGYTPEEFKRKSKERGTVQTAAEEGIEI